jgi:dolichyl-phosphate beta-glucosyltransferase
MAAAGRTILVVPCFNEALRLDLEAFDALLGAAPFDLLFVDDGSTDATVTLLSSFQHRHPDRVEVLCLPTNVGKGEAVRAGLRATIDRGAAVTGFYDADLATPPEELLRLLSIIHERPELDVVIGSRIPLLGHHVDRRPIRHYLGRTFATLCSLLLRLDVYDTQCGAKLLRVTPALQRAVERPFLSRWIFDVELLDRLVHGTRGGPLTPPEALLEVPLERWRDVAGSKVTTAGSFRAAFDLGRVALRRR